MGLATGNQTDEPVVQFLGREGAAGPHDLNGIHYDQDRAILESRSSESNEYLQILARATNDAIRDWNIASGSLSWPQGLQSLLGYSAAEESRSIEFWRERVHPADRARVAANLREAINGGNS